MITADRRAGRSYEKMYGIINRAIEVFVSERYGHEAWKSTLALSGQLQPSFVSALKYDDQTTFDLIAAAVEVSHVPESLFLEELGAHWMTRLLAEFPEITHAPSVSLPELLERLSGMRARILLLFPGSNPPRFNVSHPEPGLVHLTYESAVPGLAPLVRGMIRELGRHSGTPAEVNYRPSRREFVIRWSEE